MLTYFRHFIITIFILTPLLSQSQEKRLALVIGNANYENAPLKNPVNDALLMKETFEKLAFDVILDTNIATRKDFLETIDKFQKERENYNVGFVYYAGHAVQIDGINYMLPTKEKYESISNVKYNGLEVGIFMDQYMDPIENEINVLILDACRNNPFEKNWSGSARSLANGSGLAEIKNAPSGSLIAFSTAAGATALDGNGNEKNSTYCLSLAKNMQLENTDISKVFGIVRKEVRESIGQFPAVYDQLEGNNFYIKKSTYTDQIIEIDSLIELENYSLAREKTTSILALDPNNKQALLRKGRIEYNTIGEKYDAREIKKAIELYPSDPEVYEYMARYYSTIEKYDLAIEEIEKAIKIDSNVAQYFFWRAIFQSENDMLDSALNDYSKAIELDQQNPERYTNRGDFLRKYYQDYKSSLIDYSKAIELDPMNSQYLISRGTLYQYYLNNEEKALVDYKQILEIDSGNIDAINSIGIIYQNQGKHDLAIDQYNKGIALEKSNPESAAFCYINRAMIFEQQENIEEALNDYSIAIELNPKDPEAYDYRGNFYRDFKQDYNSALIDYSKAIELDPMNLKYLLRRGSLFQYYLKNETKALEDFNQILKIDPGNIGAINYIGIIYQNQGKLDLAIDQYNKGIALEKSNRESAAFCYNNRAMIFEQQEKLEEALNDYSKAIDLFPANPNFRIDRADFYRNKVNRPYDALVDYSLAISLDSTVVNGWSKRSHLFSNNLSDHKSAISDCEQIIKMDSNEVTILNWIGIYYHRMGMIAEASKYYDLTISKVGSKFKDSTNAYSEGISWSYNNRALIYQRTKDFLKPLEYYSKAIKYDPNRGIRYFWRGAYYNEYLKDFKNALLDIEQAIRLEPKNPRYLFYRAKINEKNGEINETLKDLDKAIKLSSHDPFYIAQRGDTYRQMKEFAMAEKDIESALKLDSNNLKIYHYKIQLLRDQNLLDEAISFGKLAISKFENDTTTQFLLGQIYQEKKDYLKAIKHYQEAISIMEFNTAYQSIEPDYYPVFLSDCYLKLGDIYSILDDKELVCENYQNAIISLEDETRPDKIELEKILQEKINQSCK